MKVFFVIGCLLLTACAKQIKVTPSIIEQTAQYSIMRLEETPTSTKYLIYTVGVSEAQIVAKERLGCKHRVCLITPGGVITQVETLKAKE